MISFSLRGTVEIRRRAGTAHFSGGVGAEDTSLVRATQRTSCGCRRKTRKEPGRTGVESGPEPFTVTVTAANEQGIGRQKAVWKVQVSSSLVQGLGRLASERFDSR